MKETLTRTQDGGAVHTVEHNGQSLSINLSADQITDIIKMAIREAKEPDDETKAKMAAEKAQREERMRQMIEYAQEEEKAKKMAMERCAHKKQDGSTTIHTGQIYSDGMIRPLCVRCQKIFTAYKAPMELIAGTGIA